MPKFAYRHEDSPGALARNWWQVLFVDALLALVVLALGVLSVVAWNAIVGWVLVLLAITYGFALIGRARVWKAQRDEAGLDG